MSAKRDDGGPAFPGTLRDWFAGQALVGLSSVQTGGAAGALLGASAANGQTAAEGTADIAFELADAMLTARAKVEPAGEPADPQDRCASTIDNGHAGTQRCEYPAGHEGVHFSNMPSLCVWGDDEMERGQAPDPPAAVVRDTVAAQPAPASADGCASTCAEGEIRCLLPAGHGGLHRNGGVSWGESAPPPMCGATTVSCDGQNFVCHRPKDHAGEHYDNLSDCRWSGHYGDTE